MEPLKSGVEERDRREREEHWRLLYVAMTRAKERLYVGGALASGAKGPPDASWIRAVEQGLGALGCHWEEDERWGGAMRFGVEQQGQPQPPPPSSVERKGVLPPWLHAPAPEEERPPRPLAPSAMGEDEASYPPPSPDQRGAAMRGKLLHRLFERLPDVPPEERHARADAWLARTGDAPDPHFRRQLIADACGVIDDPDFAELFRPAALAEAPIAAVLPGGQVVAGTVDRLLIEADRVLVADFKTGRTVPSDLGDVPPSHLRQMAAYRAAMSVIFPDRRVEAALLYTAGPVLLALPAALLDGLEPQGGG
jgi:ATP-dependent helicase/nuclease subunit A